MKQIVLGTAGHIDHGKTALVKALTGIDCDRLKEEKERGITIDIGFAHLEFPSGVKVGIVDVPGHERFVSNMLAGSHGVDMALLVVAADEGVMPQTREHMDIITLLGVKRGIIALTKVDLVDEEWLELVKEEVEDYLKGTFLEASRLIPVSVVSGQGMEELRGAIDSLAQEVEARSASGLFRLPIDRVFTIKGFGTVVTGTLISGQLKLGDEVEVLPDAIHTKVRGLQVHNQSVSYASAGLRTAVNLLGIDRTTLERGHLLAHPGLFTPTRRLEVYLNHLDSSARPLKRRSTVRFYLGTREVMAQVVPLEVEEIAPGQEAYAQLWLQAPAVASRGDRFVLRSYSPVVTIGGGVVLDPQVERKRRRGGERRAELEVLSQGDRERVVEVLARRSQQVGISLKGLAGRSGLSAQVLADAVEALAGQSRLVNLDRDRWVHADLFNSLGEELVTVLKGFHRAFPLKPGMPKEELRGKLGGRGDNRLLTRIIDELAKKGEVCLEKDNIRLTGHDLTLGKEDEELRERFKSIFQEAGLAPPLVAELTERVKVARVKVQDILNLLVSDGTLVRVKDNLFFDARTIADLKERLLGFFQGHEEITPGQYKEITGQSRKFTVPLMEYFDRVHFTLRVGDKRRLR